MRKQIYPALWFNANAKEAAEYYCTIFNDTAMKSESDYAVVFETSGQKFLCINGGPEFTPNPSISFFVLYEDKDELDKAWNKLAEGGKVLMPLDSYPWSQHYGWIQDKFNVSWQFYLGKMQDVGQKFTPSLLFTGEQNGKAEEAINFYSSLFENSSISGIMKYTGEGDDIKGNIAHAQFTLGDNVFMAMDSSEPHQFNFNEGISLVIECKTQEEIDYYWERLSAVPEAEQCGWLKDKYGVAWQVVPEILEHLMEDPEKATRVAEAFMQMKKFDIQKLQEAYGELPKV